LRKAISLKSGYGPAWEHLGLAYQKMGRHKDAVAAFEKATQLMPGNRVPWQHLSEEYAATSRPVDAQQAAARARKLPATVTSSKKS
jgi:Flp pilus assembly protein TadD